MASEASALNVTLILLVGALVLGSVYAGTSREGAKRSGSVIGVPENPVFWTELIEMLAVNAQVDVEWASAQRGPPCRTRCVGCRGGVPAGG